jgi:centrosomal protein CEP104
LTNLKTTDEIKSQKFKKIGYLALDSNERSSFKARELKSVYVDYLINAIKISLHRCHSNVHNTFLQVGLIAVNVLGDYLTKTQDQVNMNNNYFNEGATKLEEEMNYDPATLKRLKALYKAKEKAIELEDFDEAKKIKDAIVRLKGVSQQLIQYEERKRIAIKNDDFDAAKMLKYEIERLRNAVVGLQLAEGGPHQINTNTNNIKPVYKKPIQDDYDEFNENDHIPLGQEKIKLMPMAVNKNFNNGNEIPLTSDLVLEEDDRINMTKKVNSNQGYKLRDKNEIKQKIDVDNQVIKGNDKDFSEMVNEKLQDKKNSKVANKDPIEIEEEISAADYKKAEPLIPVLSLDIVKMLFSKQWRNKEEGMKILIEEISKHPNSQLLSPHGADKVLIAIVGASANVLTCSITQPLMATMDMLKILFNKFRGSSIDGYYRGDFDNYVDQCMLNLIEKVGDANLKLKEKAENTIMEFANSPLVGHKTVFEDLIMGQVKKTLVKSAKHMSGRINLISRMIDNFGLNEKDVPIDSLISYSVNAYKDPNKEIREAAFNLIMKIYGYVGDEVRKYFKDLRPAQVKQLEEGFESLDGMNQEVQNNDNQEYEDMNKPQSKKNVIATNINPSKQNAKKMEENIPRNDKPQRMYIFLTFRR